jgi:2-oxoisovalerate dehydrogenase E1 component
MAGVSVEVIDLRTMYPLDVETILESVKKTNRLLVAHEDVLFMGFGAEIAAIVAEQAFEYLDAPIMRVGGKYTPIPHSPILEKAVLPNADWVEAAAEKLLSF